MCDLSWGDFLLQFLTSVKQVNMEELLDVYEESNMQFGKKVCPAGSSWEQTYIGEKNMREYVYEFLKIDGACLAIYTVGSIIASAARLEPYQDGYLLSGLETLPALRNNGYASALLMGILNQVAVPIYSHIKRTNRSSISVHENAGFIIISDFAKLVDGTVSRSYFTLKYVK